MRTPNTKCCICEKPLYRRPFELKTVRYVACMEHREEAKRMFPITSKQKEALALGRVKGDNRRFGTKHKEETKQKISKSHKIFCLENPDKVAERGKKMRGEKHYNWKGGSSRLNTAIRQLTEYRRWMDAVVRRDGNCSKCGVNTDLEAHHIKPMAEIITKHNIKTREQARKCIALWALLNGITFCERCHYEHHGRTYTSSGNGRRKKPRKDRSSMAGSANPNYKGGNVPLTCPQCGTTFKVKPSETSKRKYCSRGCANESQRKNI